MIANGQSVAYVSQALGISEAELLEGGAFLSVEDAHTELFDYIEVYYNRVRKHSSLGYKKPDQFEQEYYTNLTNQCVTKSDHPNLL